MSTVHILVADDDQLFRQILGGQMVKRGFEIIYAADGNEARETARRLKPDLILLDYRMPVFDGLTTAKYIKQEEATKDIPVMMLTNEDVSLEAQKIWNELGVDGYLHKSSDAETVYGQIVGVLKKYGKDIPRPKKAGGPK
jgi:CheY-like chemotaxis protein